MDGNSNRMQFVNGASQNSPVAPHQKSLGRIGSTNLSELSKDELLKIINQQKNIINKQNMSLGSTLNTNDLKQELHNDPDFGLRFMMGILDNN